MRRGSFLCIGAVVIGLTLLGGTRVAAADHYGQVVFKGVPVPGAVVTATGGERPVVTATDESGVYHLGGLDEGAWTIRVEMPGFATVTESVAITGDSTPRTWELTLLPFEEVAARARTGGEARSVAPSEPPNEASAGPPSGFGQAPGSTRATTANSTSDVAPSAVDSDRAADGFLVNGSVNNGASSPFAQLAAFGNNRRSVRSLYNGGLGVVLGNSAWDSRPFSFADAATTKPQYTDAQVLGSFAGPLRIPRLIRNGPNLFLGYQHALDHNATTQSALVPSLLERSGDFSRSADAFGRPIQIVDPSTGAPFPGNVIPQDRISPQAAALLGFYPQPNVNGSRFNYQTPVVTSTRQDSFQSRFSQIVRGRNQVFGTLAYQRLTTDAADVFGFLDSTRVSGVDGAVNWSHRFSQFFSLRLRYQHTQLTTSVTPYFANRENVSGEAGIAGNDQAPINWGPPALVFSSGLAGLGSAQSGVTSSVANGWGGEILWSHRRHTVTFGGDVRRQHWNALGQQDARGTFAFSGAFTGSDLADFLLGIPHTSSIAFGNADKYLRSFSYDAYATDDWRFGPALTLNVGVRWEYEAPMTERYGRLVNLDIAPGFTAVSPVEASSPLGPLTHERYPDSLVRPDRRGFQPRVGVAWRPVPGSSLVIRAGYGVYRNTNVYAPVAMLMAQQPPLSKTSSVENSAANPFTLANGFVGSSMAGLNTFAVDPNLRVGSAQNWQVLMQRDLPASLTMTATYLGTKGSHLMREFLPNTVPAGAANPCPSCPAGFVYLTSGGASNRQAGQMQFRRRLRNGLTATIQYTLSKATDDAAGFSAAESAVGSVASRPTEASATTLRTTVGGSQSGSSGLNGASIAQDWENLEAEWGPSSFDQRHLVVAQVQYTTGVGAGGGGLMTGTKGSLLAGWTLAGQLTAGSGLPLTPVYLTSVTGTGVVGTLRPDLTGAPTAAASPGYYVNPLGYSPPAAGRWGNAGRNSITGPAQFSLNAGVARTFTWGDRLNLDWRIDATNVLNRVTYASVNTIVGSPQFGLPNRANPMRRVQSTLRLRF